jgi:hypothetical protein
MDQYREVTSQSWISRIGSSLKGIVWGLVLLLISLGVLFWNEGRAVKQAKVLGEGASLVRAVGHDQVRPENEGQLVHLAGPSHAEKALLDEQFGVKAPLALKLRRTVKMYQWAEVKQTKAEKKLGGSEETTTNYQYQQGWYASLIASDHFKLPEGHTNPTSFRYTSREFAADPIKLGAFHLSASLTARLNRYEKLLPEPSPRADSTLSREGSHLYIGQGSLERPQIGDYLVEFEVVKPAHVSIVAKQEGNQLTPYLTTGGGSIALLQPGNIPAQALFAGAQDDNTALTWVLRLAGLVFVFLGLNLLLKPLAVLGDVVPLVGNLLRAGIGLVSGVLALASSLTVIALGWLFYRPLLGVSLMLIVVACMLLLKRLQNRPQQAPALTVSN